MTQRAGLYGDRKGFRLGSRDHARGQRFELDDGPVNPDVLLFDPSDNSVVWVAADGNSTPVFDVKKAVAECVRDTTPAAYFRHVEDIYRRAFELPEPWNVTNFLDAQVDPPPGSLGERVREFGENILQLPTFGHEALYRGELFRVPGDKSKDVEPDPYERFGASVRDNLPPAHAAWHIRQIVRKVPSAAPALQPFAEEIAARLQNIEETADLRPSLQTLVATGGKRTTRLEDGTLHNLDNRGHVFAFDPKTGELYKTRRDNTSQNPDDFFPLERASFDELVQAAGDRHARDNGGVALATFAAKRGPGALEEMLRARAARPTIDTQNPSDAKNDRTPPPADRLYWDTEQGVAEIRKQAKEILLRAPHLAETLHDFDKRFAAEFAQRRTIYEELAELEQTHSKADIDRLIAAQSATDGADQSQIELTLAASPWAGRDKNLERRVPAVAAAAIEQAETLAQQESVGIQQSVGGM